MDAYSGGVLQAISLKISSHLDSICIIFKQKKLEKERPIVDTGDRNCPGGNFYGPLAAGKKE
jgi:hypothetical protein